MNVKFCKDLKELARLIGGQDSSTTLHILKLIDKMRLDDRLNTLERSRHLTKSSLVAIEIEMNEILDELNQMERDLP